MQFTESQRNWANIDGVLPGVTSYFWTELNFGSFYRAVKICQEGVGSSWTFRVTVILGERADEFSIKTWGYEEQVELDFKMIIKSYQQWQLREKFYLM